MTDSDVVLSEIHALLSQQPHEIVGDLSLTDEALTVFDDQVAVRVAVRDDPDMDSSIAHCHVTVNIMDDHSGHLDACVMGMDADREASLRGAGQAWVTSVAPPLFSMLKAQPVMDAAHFDGAEVHGVSGCHGFVGPLVGRILSPEFELSSLEGCQIFDYAAELAPPGLLHLAKVTLNVENGHWRRTIEVDGHQACFVQPEWSAGPVAPASGVISQFAIFHYSDQPEHVAARQQVDDAIRTYVDGYAKSGSLMSPEQLQSEGVPSELASRVTAFTQSAFGRMILLSLGATPAATCYRVQADGTLSDEQPLMHEPVYARAWALLLEWQSSDLWESCYQIALTSAEVDALNQAVHAGSKPEDVKAMPLLIPDPNVGESAMRSALREFDAKVWKSHAPRRPWWKFW